MKIAVIGMGFVGLALISSALSEGHEVVVIDINPLVFDFHRKNMKDGGDIKNITEYLELQEHKERMYCFLDYNDESLKEIDKWFICVDTPNVEPVAYRINELIKSGDMVFLESTVTIEQMNSFRKIVLTGKTDEFEFNFCVSPERIMEGKLMENFKDLVKIIGCDSYEMYLKFKEIYNEMGVKNTFIVKPEEACLIKMWENYHRYRQIREAHQLADICEDLNLDFDVVREGIMSCGYHRWIAESSIGIGGTCLEKDSRLLFTLSPHLKCVLEDVSYEVDRHYKILEFLKHSLLRTTGRELKDTKVLFFGATYRPDGSDYRNSPALKIIDSIAGALNKYWIYDPNYPTGWDDRVVMTDESWKSALIESHAIVILMPHEEFTNDIEDALLIEPRIALVNLSRLSILEIPDTCNLAERRF